MRVIGHVEGEDVGTIGQGVARALAVSIASAVVAAISASAEAGIVYAVSFDDPASQYTAYYSEIETGIEAAGATWATYLAGNASIAVEVRFSTIATESGASAASVFVGTDGPLSVYEQGVAAQLRSGVSANPGGPDAIVTIGGSYLTDDLWFDPDPHRRTASVPSNKVDAQSVFLHEFGHILGFNGFRDPITGALPGSFESTFDRYVVAGAGGLSFTGPEAEAVYGAPVPLTLGNYVHVGNLPPEPGADLLGDLMNGVAFEDGRRYDISPLDLAVLADAGVGLTANAATLLAEDIPEPSSLALLLVPLVGLILTRPAAWHRLTSAARDGG
jgi:hypothetical protein